MTFFGTPQKFRKLFCSIFFKTCTSTITEGCFAFGGCVPSTEYPFYRAMLGVSAVCCRRRPVSVCLSVHPSVRLCVCPSDTFVYCIKTAKDIVIFLSLTGSPIILVFWRQSLMPNSKGTPSSGALNTRGCENCAIFNWIGRLHRKTVRDRPICCYGTLIGNHSWRIDPCRFRWPWVTRGDNFQADLVSNARTVFARMTKFGRITCGRGAYFWR